VAKGEYAEGPRHDAGLRPTCWWPAPLDRAAGCGRDHDREPGPVESLRRHWPHTSREGGDPPDFGSRAGFAAAMDSARSCPRRARAEAFDAVLGARPVWRRMSLSTWPPMGLDPALIAPWGGSGPVSGREWLLATARGPANEPGLTDAR